MAQALSLNCSATIKKKEEKKQKNRIPLRSDFAASSRLDLKVVILSKDDGTSSNLFVLFGL